MLENTITIAPYDKNWPFLFAQEAQRLQNALAPWLKAIHHIGSTAIPNLAAKPIVDMLLEFEDLDEIDSILKELNQLNYYQLRRSVVPHRSFFISRHTQLVGYHLHLLERGDPQTKRHLHFKDYLIHHPHEAKAYAALKLQLAEKFSKNRDYYTFEKSIFVQAIDAKAKKWINRRRDFLSANTGKICKSWSNEKIIKAIEANLNVHMTHFAQYLDQVELKRIPGYTLIHSGLTDDTFNYLLDADFSEETAITKIQEITHYFKNKNCPFSWWLNPYDKPESLSAFLKKAGYQNTENNIAMYFDLDSLDETVYCPSELEIIRATDEKTLIDFALILTNDETSFKQYFSWIASVLTSEDPIEYYVGYVQGKPVVRGLSCYFAQVAGLYWLSTSLQEQKKGYGTAMQQFSLQRAKELGYHTAVLQASAVGYPLYQKLGYRNCGIFKEFKLSLQE